MGATAPLNGQRMVAQKACIKWTTSIPEERLKKAARDRLLALKRDSLVEAYKYDNPRTISKKVNSLASQKQMIFKD